MFFNANYVFNKHLWRCYHLMETQYKESEISICQKNIYPQSAKGIKKNVYQISTYNNKNIIKNNVGIVGHNFSIKY